jgi:histidine ammonia-lyase
MLLALRINILCKGYSGISIENLEKYVEAFNKDILPLVPEQGTVGASGDLAPLAHLAAGLLGYGKVYNFKTNQYESAEIMLKQMEFAPIVLNEKEGLALINGT